MNALKTHELTHEQIAKAIQTSLGDAYTDLVADSIESEVFLSHMKSLVARVENNELLDSDRTEYAHILSEISAQSFEITQRIVKALHLDDETLPVFEKVLVATHIQTYLARKEAENNE